MYVLIYAFHLFNCDHAGALLSVEQLGPRTYSFESRYVFYHSFLPKRWVTGTEIQQHQFSSDVRVGNTWAHESLSLHICIYLYAPPTKLGEVMFHHSLCVFLFVNRPASTSFQRSSAN